MRKNRNLLVVVISFILIALVLSSCGRTKSRLKGKEYRQILNVENFETFISVSFDKRGSSTVKDVTFLAADGYVYTQEFKDASIFEGVIRWVPHGQKADLIQSRAISRWTGGAVNVELPDDCIKILGVDIGYKSKSKRVKNLTYLASDTTIYSKEYREGIIGREFEGWLEIKPK